MQDRSILSVRLRKVRLDHAAWWTATSVSRQVSHEQLETCSAVLSMSCPHGPYVAAAQPDDSLATQHTQPLGGQASAIELAVHE